MADISNIDLSGVEPNASFDPLPDGWYAMRIVADEVKDTKAGDGRYLQLEHEIDENYHPEFKGRKVWSMLNLWNPNVKTVDIAKRDLEALRRACGIDTLTESKQLHGITVEVHIKTKPADGQYEARNIVRGYRPISGSAPAASAPAGQAAARPAQRPAPAKAVSAPPWAKTK